MNLVVLDTAGASPLVVTREPEGEARYEDVLRDMLFANPEMLPYADVDPSIGRVVSVAREFQVPDVGRIDALLIDERGRLIIVECKLWRNPEARREVVGQILDYARALAKFSYDDLQRQVSHATKRQGNVLYDLVREAGSDISEARFVDQVSRDLAAGRFLLLIVGDGITEGTQRIGEYLQGQAGLAFTFGLIEMAQYKFRDPLLERVRVIVQPRVLARTTNIERIVIRSEMAGIIIEEVAPQAAPTQRTPSEFGLAWRAFADRLIAAIRFDDPGQPPPRNGGVGWLRVPLPGPAHLTLWRSQPQQLIGAFARFTDADGMATYDLLASERSAIDDEFASAELPVPIWERKDGEASISLTANAQLPWNDEAEAQQIAGLASTANQFVNSLRPRLLALGHGAG